MHEFGRVGIRGIDQQLHVRVDGPREVAPEQSKNEIYLGFSGTEMSNSSMPAGCSPFFWVW